MTPSYGVSVTMHSGLSLFWLCENGGEAQWTRVSHLAPRQQQVHVLPKLKFHVDSPFDI